MEFFYQLIYECTLNKGVAVIGLSFVVTALTLPLYMVSERWQEKERHIHRKMDYGVRRIKAVFKGDERYMILSAFYAENHYHPIMALRSSFSLLIQIPFFIAAYYFLSNLGTLKGYSFLFIKDFGVQDGALHVPIASAGYVNVLPIAMTAINCVSGALYSKGHGVNEKVQIYSCAAVFLVLLYHSPAGLVVYWTMNNILSLLKNIFYRIKHPKAALYVCICIFAVVCIVSPFTLLADIKKLKKAYKLAIVVFGLLLPVVPLAAKEAWKFFKKHFSVLEKNATLRFFIFFVSALSIAVLSGIVIPSILMESEPNNFCYIDNYKSPFVFLGTAFFQAIGFFIFWPLCFYFLFGATTKKALCVISCCGVFLSAINCFAFSGDYGPIEATLMFMQPQNFFPAIKGFFLNLFVLFAIIVLIAVALAKKPKLLQSFSSILLLALLAISVRNVALIAHDFSEMEAPAVPDFVEPVYHLSKSKKNVVVIMQDKLFSPFVDNVLDECPKLREEFDGFTFYPNTISMGERTMTGTPGLFGGYDYTPYEINLRDTETLQKKHNEALLTMPVLFSRNGFVSYVSNLPYENYLEQPQAAMYNDYPEIQRRQTKGAYSDIWYKKHGIEKSPFRSFMIKRNFICFSFFKMVPPILRQAVYHNKYWLSYNPFDDISSFVDNYSALEYLSALVSVDSDKGSFILLDNETAHESILLQPPDFILPATEGAKSSESEWANTPFSSTMCGIFLRCAEFFDYLKKEGCYDNTRIIIVSDHGTPIETGKFVNRKEWDFKKEDFVSTLLVKDFGERGAMKEDMTFMTNADTPYLATKGLINDAKNPFTGNSLYAGDKAACVKMMDAPAQSTRIRYDTKFKIRSDQWYTVKDNIFEDSNWKKFLPD